MLSLTALHARSLAAYPADDGPCTEQLFHIESMGVRSTFRKSFCAQRNASDLPEGERTVFFPVLTAVIAVDAGRVTEVTWDDGCYFTDADSPAAQQSCEPNRFALDSRAALDSVPAPAQGSDTALTRAACRSQPRGFCDLAVYVAWTGTDADGRHMGSAGRRFSVFRRYALQPQFDAMRLFLLGIEPSLA